MMDVFTNKWRIPNSLEKVYAKHIIGKRELKTKLGQLHIGAVTEKTFMLNTLVLDLFDVAKLPHVDGLPDEEVLELASHTYNIPLDKDNLMSDLFDLSLTHNIVEVNPDNARIYLARSKNGKTNITTDIMELLLGIMSPKVKGY